jgi:CRP-like cAMP-binding protein
MTWSNHFLDALPPETLAGLKDDLELVALTRGDLIVEVDKPVAGVILPVNSIISVIAVMSNGDQVESRTIGKESGFGLLHALGSPISYERLVVQVSGQAWRIKTKALAEAAKRDPVLTHAIVSHAQATIVQTTHLTACNALHTAAARLARWLLMTQDRLGGGEIVPLTQEHLSIMVGVQRTTITTLASALQEQGLISYSRGKIRIVKREGLRQEACECYGTITAQVRRILSEKPSSPVLQVAERR